MSSNAGAHRWGVTLASTVAAGALGAGLLVGAAPVSAVTGAGIIVSALVTPQDAAPNRIVLRATRDAIESDVAITREGNTVVITETEFEDGPSLGLQEPSSTGVTCTASSPSGLSEEIRCTFTGATASGVAHVFADFADSPQGVTFGSDGSGDIQFLITGSAFDDYFEGGRRDDVIYGGGGDDFLIGGGGNDRLFGGVGDDVIYGDGEDGDGTKGNDWIEGGPGDDYIEGGPGVDSMWGGPGRDDLAAKDNTADAVVDCNDSSGRGQDTEDIVFDVKLDRPFDCGVNEAPESLTAPVLLGVTSPQSPGDRLTGVAATWRGTNPMTYSYAWESCSVARDGSIARCVERGSGALSAKGKDAKTGKDPQYRVSKADVGKVVRFVSSADNSKLRGGAEDSVSSNVSNVVEPGIFFKFPPWTMPFFQEGGPGRPRTWLFPTALVTRGGEPQVDEIVPWLMKSEIAKNITITYEAVPRKDVPKQWRKDIRNADVFEVRVDGQSVTPKDPLVEVSAKGRSEVLLRYWNRSIDTLDCSMTSAELAALDKSVRSVPTDYMDVIGPLEQKGCSYNLQFWKPRTDLAAPRPVTEVLGVELYGSDPETGEAGLLVRVREPSRGSLLLATGAPRGSNVAQAPDQPTIGVTGFIPSFGGKVPFGAVWVGLVGDQARQPTTPARVDVFQTYLCAFEEQPQCWATLETSGKMTGPFSTNVTVPLGDGGGRSQGVRILVTTFHDPEEPGDKLVPREQVFVDIPLRDASENRAGDLLTLDGRCFNQDGRLLQSCAAWDSDVLARQAHQAVASESPQLATFAPTEALRYASQVLDLGIRPVFANETHPMAVAPFYRSRVDSVDPRSGACAWWDLACLVKGIVTRIVDAIVKPTPPKGRPKVPTVSYRMGVPVIYLGEGDSVLAIGNDSVLYVPGVGLIGLDGATLIGLDGATLISDQGGSLIGLDGATLIGLDGATLIGLDGATFQGKTPLVLAPPGLISDQGGS